MGFDPIMMAISNDYTDSKQLAVVDLTKYDAGGNSLNDVVLGLFVNGGGKSTVSNTDGVYAFWHDVSDDRSIRISIDAMSVKILANANSFTFTPDGVTVVAIETSFLIINGGSTFRVTVLMGCGAETEITVAVEPVTVHG